VPPEGLEAQLAPFAALAEPARRALYRFVVSQPEPVGREEAAVGVGVAHHVAKFHLDKLVEEGLLDVEYRRPAGRGGPGAGRPTKLYRRSAREFDVTIPERRYELAGRLLARAVDESRRDNVPVDAALERAAAEAGRELGDEIRLRIVRRSRRLEVLDRTVEVLSDHGYDPRVDPGGVTLTNCPFHRLAQEHTALVCGRYHCMLDAMITAADPDGRSGLHAVLDASPERCCVRLVKNA
jgi:predicted ArsR family transcriptional regulator